MLGAITSCFSRSSQPKGLTEKTPLIREKASLSRQTSNGSMASSYHAYPVH
jgi:hypothetical protein